MPHLCYLCLVFVMLPRLFAAACGHLNSWLLFVMFNCVFVTFPCGILCQVRHLIVSIPDLSSLSYFKPVSDVCLWLGPPWLSCVLFVCPKRNFGRHIVITLSVRPASCPVHISYILRGRNSKFGVWIHLGMAECRIPF